MHHSHGKLPVVTLKKGRGYSASHFHPWIFSGAIESITDEPNPGELVKVISDKGEPVGVGTWSPSSQIRIRLVSFGADSNFSCFDAVQVAIEARSQLMASGYTNAIRLVNGEADGLPGVIVDKYDDWAVCQFNTAGAARMKNEIVVALLDALPLRGIYERSDADGRRYEGLEECCGHLVGEEPPERIEIFEGEVKYFVDVRKGHKTGYYLDQRDNRRIVATAAKGLDVLNVFSYTGGFGVAALVGGAKSSVHVDLSQSALEIAKANTSLNGFEPNDEDFICGNAFDVLRKFRDSRRTFDFIVLDPPKFADAKSHLRGAARGYKDINLLAMKLLRPGGMLATFSCSGLMTPDLFTKVVSEAAVDSGRNFQIQQRLWQASDHPDGLFFPEGLYLKGLLLKHLQ